MEVAGEIDKERRKNKLVFMRVAEEGEDWGGSGIAEKVNKEILKVNKVKVSNPESEVK